MAGAYTTVSLAHMNRTDTHSYTKWRRLVHNEMADLLHQFLLYLQAATKIRYAQGFYFSKPIFLEELGALGRTASAVRTVSENRPMPETRPVYSRANGYGR